MDIARLFEPPPPRQGFVIGVDEVGRGSLAGDVYAAGVLVHAQGKPVAGITDSKKLTATQRVKLSRALQECSEIHWVIARRSAQVIDQKGIFEATVECFHECIQALLQKTPPDPVTWILVDGLPCWPTGTYSIPTHFIPKGDLTEWSIGAASILAKVARDDYMLTLGEKYPAYGWAQNKGYGTAGHIAALKIHGLSPEHRTKFAQTAIGESRSPGLAELPAIDLNEIFGLEDKPSKVEPDPRYDLPDLE